MKARIKVERLVRWEKCKSLSSLELHEEVVSCIIVSVSDDSFSSYPQVYLIEEKGGALQNIYTYTHTYPSTYIHTYYIQYAYMHSVHLVVMANHHCSLEVICMQVGCGCICIV